MNNKLKINKMKNILIIASIILSIVSCKAQHIIPVEDVVNYINSETGLMGDQNYVYVKDVSGTLNKFTGIWKGTYDNKSYEFRVVKVTEDDGELKEDKLLIRYKIIDSDSTIIEDTTTLPNDSYYVIKGDYLAKSGSYVLKYIGKNSKCGQGGDVFISVYGTNNTKMQLFLHVYGETIDCTTGDAEQVLPLNQMDLTKQ